MTTEEIDPADAVRVWQRVVYAPRDLVDQLDIPADAAETLTVVGPPVSVEPLFAAVPPTAITLIDGSRLVRLGTDFGTSICLRLPDGPVISAPDSPGLPVRHVNADLPRFAWFLLETCRSRQQFPELGDEQIDELIGKWNGACSQSTPVPSVTPTTGGRSSTNSFETDSCKSTPVGVLEPIVARSGLRRDGRNRHLAPAARRIRSAD